MPVQTMTAARASALPSVDPDPLSPEAALLDTIGEVAGDRVVIVGHDTLGVMCAVIRGGADAATVLRLHERPEAHEADLAVIVAPDCPAECAAAIGQASRALAPSGRVVVGRVATGLAGQVVALLRRHGFTGIVARPGGGEATIAAELPFFAGVGGFHA